MIGALVALVLAQSAAADLEPCTDAALTTGIMSASRYPGARGCRLMVTRPCPDRRCRTFSLTSEGMFMVNNSLGEGKLGATTGARVYFFFPRSATPSFTRQTDDDLQITLPNGEALEFDDATGAITSFSGGTVTEAAEVSGANNGGFEIPTIRRGLVLDCGWRRGETPHAVASRESRFRDPAGHRCSLRNSEIFRYADGEADHRYPTDSALADFLARRCPSLDVSSLRPPAGPGAGTPPASSSSGAGTASDPP